MPVFNVLSKYLPFALEILHSDSMENLEGGSGLDSGLVIIVIMFRKNIDVL